MSTSKFNELFKTYGCDELTDAQVKQEVAKILAEHLDENNNVDVYKVQ